MAIKWKIFSAIWKLSIISKRFYRARKHLLLVLFVLAFTIVTFFFVASNSDEIKISSNNYTEKLEEMLIEDTIMEDKGTGCEMPELNPFSEEAMQYYKDTPKVVCEGVDWIECNYSECYVVKDILNKMNNIICNYKDIVYVNDRHYYISDPVKVYGYDKYYLNKSDHVKVSCTAMDKNGLGILLSRWFGYKAGFRPVPQRKSPPGRENSLNIMILCFDSASHNGFIRKMPKSYQFLKNQLNATILKSYNIVGEGTINALYPMLTGLDLPDWKTFPKNKYLDVNKFLFHHFKQDGYRTAYLEDMPWIGTFQRTFQGYNTRPADYYLRAMLMEESANGKKWWHGIKGRYCLGSIPQYGLMLNLTKQFLDMQGKRFCLTFIADISHEDFNTIATSDDDVVTFLEQFRDRGRLQNTLLIVMGDHGTKFENIRKTYQGRIEERLPFIAIMLPNQLKQSRPGVLHNLKANVDVLTTPYDLHTTLLDVVGLKKIANTYKIPGANIPRAMSMLDPIPKSRSCSEAGIKPYWCACAKWRNVSKTDPIYKQAAQVLADYIDNITFDTRSLCAKRMLTSIQWVMRRLPNSELSMQGKKQSGYFWENTISRAEHEYYQVKITMSPGEAIFEASMNYYVKEDYFLIIEKDISRISAYANESYCLSETNPHLHKYCYCEDKLKIAAQEEENSQNVLFGRNYV